MGLAAGYIIAIFGAIAIIIGVTVFYLASYAGSGIGSVGTSMRAALPLHRTNMEYLQQ
jgi:hypothetical protein